MATRKIAFIPLLTIVLAASILLAVVPAWAQGQCGFTESIGYPVDTNVFRLSQDFAAPSPRHQGRYHTGEDWFAGRANNYGAGLPIYAAAAGRVTYSAPLGWGRDGGVVIIEHTFPDGAVAYTHYGHMMETDSARFPAIYSCVQAGEIIGAVGDVRPAPHLHFEIRANNGDSPGPGYSWENPVEAGWRRPSKFVLNWQTWLLPAYRWRLDLRDETGPAAPPLELEDGSLIYLDAGRVGRVSPDGRSLWRINLDQAAVGVTLFEGAPLLSYASGVMQRVTLDGALAESWDTGVALDRFVATLGNLALFHTPDQLLAAFDESRQQVVWQASAAAPVVRSVGTGQLLAVITERNELLTFSPQGQQIDRAQLRALASLEAAQDDSILAYTMSGLWSIGTDGLWVSALKDAPGGSASSAIFLAPDGQLYLFDGRILHAYGPNWSQSAALLWQVEIPDVSGMAELTGADGVLLLSSSHGHFVALRAGDGALCNRARIFGDDRARAWRSLGQDGTLRAAVADQIIGLNWNDFLGGCAS